MHQREIDHAVGNVMTGAILGVVLAVVLMARYPLRTLAIVLAGFVFYGGALLVDAGIKKYDRYVMGVEIEKARVRQIAIDHEEKLYHRASAIKDEAWRPVWKRIGELTNLEKLEYQGNARAKAFREDFKIPADEHPDSPWLNFDSFVEADKAAGDEDFPRTRAQVQHVLAKLATADRYLKGVAENKSYFSGARPQLILSDEFIKEFGQPSAAARKVIPPPGPAATPAAAPRVPVIERRTSDGRTQVLEW